MSKKGYYQVNILLSKIVNTPHQVIPLKYQFTQFTKLPVATFILLIFIFTSQTQNAWTQAIFSNPITGTNPNTANPYTTGQTVNTNMTVSGIGRGTGIVGTNATDRYNANSWNTTSIDMDAYFEFTLTPSNGYEIDLNNFTYTSQTSDASIQFFAFRSSIDNYTTNIGTPTSSGTTISLTAGAYQNITSALTFRFYAWGANAATRTFSINSFTFNGNVNAVAVNSITTGTISGAPFTANCSGSSSPGSVNFTSIGTYATGNTYTAQLSNSVGDFSSPTEIGSLSSTANSGTINLAIPANSSSGSGYKIRVISSNPAIIGTTTNDFTITQTGSCPPPYLTSVIYDGCNSGLCTNEGETEIIFGNTGGQSLVVSAANLNLNYTTGTDYDLIGTIVSSPSKTIEMNANAGCPGLFIDAHTLTLNPNSKFMLVSSNICNSALNWSSLCGSGPIYVVYAAAGTSGNTWRTSGNFGNQDAIKTFNLQTNSSLGSSTINYTYDPPSNATDGNYVTYNQSGGSPVTSGNLASCTITPVVLSTELLSFTAEKINTEVILNWSTASETNNDFFEIDHSVDGYTWTKIGRIKGTGTTQEPRYYSTTHYKPLKGINYYRLNSSDFDGKIFDEGITSILLENENSIGHYNPLIKSIVLTNSTNVEIFSVEGKLIYSGINNTVIPINYSGIILLHDLISLQTQRIFIPL